MKQEDFILTYVAQHMATHNSSPSSALQLAEDACRKVQNFSGGVLLDSSEQLANNRKLNKEMASFN